MLNKLHSFWKKNQFKIILIGFFLILTVLIYKQTSSRNIKIPNPNFSTISDFEALECQPLARSGASVINSIEQKLTQVWARDSRKKSAEKKNKKWLVKQAKKIYLGTYTKTLNQSYYIDFNDVFDLVEQKNETKLIGSRLKVSTSPDNLKFVSLLFDKTKGILSLSTNLSWWYGTESIGGYQEIFTCKKIKKSSLGETRGLPETDIFSQAAAKLDQIPEINKIKQKIIEAGRKPFYLNEGIQDKIITLSLRESFPDDAHTHTIAFFVIDLNNNSIMVKDIDTRKNISLENWKREVTNTWKL